jgi:tagatose 1,6-diphosphate aldolase
MWGVAIDAGSGLAAALREARGAAAAADDLLTFKRCVVRALSPIASTVLVDAQLGPDLLADFAPGCAPMLAFEADVYRISNEERITVVPDDLGVEDYPGLGVRHLKFFMYYAPRGDPALNGKKQDLVRRIGESCRKNRIRFLFEPLVYHDDIAPGGAEYARLKPDLVREATAVFADERFFADVLKVEVPVDFDFVEGFGQGLMSLPEAEDAFRDAASAAAGIPLVYLSAGVTFDRFRASLEMARGAGVDYAGFMCGRAIWSDGIAVFGDGGEPALTGWLEQTGANRLRELGAAAGTGG